MKTLLPFFAVLIMLTGCGSDPSDSLKGTWKNADGGLLRFADDKQVYLGQEGYPDEKESTFEVRDDSVFVTVLSEEPEEPSNTYSLYASGDTLYLVAITLQQPGVQRTIPVEELAMQTGRPAYKFHFTRMQEKK